MLRKAIPTTSVFAVAVLFGTSALAQESQKSEGAKDAKTTQSQESKTKKKEETRAERQDWPKKESWLNPEQPKLLLRDVGMSAEVGGGVVGFTDSDVRQETSTGGSWTARLTIGTRSLVGAELAYTGSAQGIRALGLDPEAMLVGNGVEANVRVNILEKSAIQPYVFAGLGYKHYSIQNISFNTSDVNDTDNVAEIPVGAGVAYRNSGFIGNLRFSMNPALESSLIPSPEPSSASPTTQQNLRLNNWNVGARVGFEF